MIVADASLMTKLIVGEVDSQAAEDWFLGAEGEVVAPDLLAIEVAQAIVRRVNMRDVSVETGLGIMTTWRTILDGGAVSLLRTSSGQVEMAAGLAMRLGYPIKDCIYLALAMDWDCALATCDTKFAEKVRPMYPAIRLLTDYAS